MYRQVFEKGGTAGLPESFPAIRIERLLTRSLIDMQRVCARLAGLFATLLAAGALTLYPGGAVFGAGPDSDELEWLSKRHPKEIFDYCLDLHPFDSGLRTCLSRQLRIRKRILVNAIDQLGTYTDALSLYNQCKEYYPLYGVVPIGECVATRLILHDRLDFEVVEQFIYKKCEEKWRKHSTLAIRNCVMYSANTYLQKGILPDW